VWISDVNEGATKATIKNKNSSVDELLVAVPPPGSGICLTMKYSHLIIVSLLVNDIYSSMIQSIYLLDSVSVLRFMDGDLQI
jgi:hypothetical protein